MMTMRLIFPAALAIVLPSLAMAQVPPIQPPPGLAVDGSNAVLPNTLANLGGVPHVATTATLAAATTASYPSGVWRDHYYAGGVADGPSFFDAATGTCAANGLVNDGGNCVDAADGNSFKAVHPSSVFNIKEFGARCDRTTDDAIAAQNALNAAAAGSTVALPAGASCYFASSITVPPGATLDLSARAVGVPADGSYNALAGGAVYLANTATITLGGTGSGIARVQNGYIINKNLPAKPAAQAAALTAIAAYAGTGVPGRSTATGTPTI